jgi:hypothetical protein
MRAKPARLFDVVNRKFIAQRNEHVRCQIFRGSVAVIGEKFRRDLENSNTQVLDPQSQSARTGTKSIFPL